MKNTGEFLPFVLEPVTIDGVDGSTTALDLALHQFQTFQTTPPPHTTAERQKVLKVIYCLGSFLRGNRPAQIHFGAAGGPATLSKALLSVLRNKEQTIFDRKFSLRLLNLASDTVTDVALHASHHTDDVGEQEGGGLVGQKVDAAILDAYTSAAWCDAVRMALSETAARRDDETALRAVHTLTPHCSWSLADIGNTLAGIREEWEAQASADLLHPDVLRERVGLVEATLQLLQDSHDSAAR